MNDINASKFIRLSFCLYRGLLIFYPTTFRARFEHELIQTYKDVVAQNKSNGNLVSFFGLLIWLLLDLFASIVIERYQEWRLAMKSKWFFVKRLGVLLLALWFTGVGIGIGRSLFNLPIGDPYYWIFDKPYYFLGLNTLNIGFLFVPFLVLLIFLIPSLRINRVSTGDEVLQIRLLHMTKTNLFIIAGCGVITVLLWAVILFARLGWL